MDEFLKLPVGVDNFEKIRREGFYYVDKTKLIEQLLEQWGEVNLFTRPRRFGKTLNMSMLRSFFEIGSDAGLFQGLYISRNQVLCERAITQIREKRYDERLRNEGRNKILAYGIAFYKKRCKVIVSKMDKQE